MKQGLQKIVNGTFNRKKQAMKQWSPCHDINQSNHLEAWIIDHPTIHVGFIPIFPTIVGKTSCTPCLCFYNKCIVSDASPLHVSSSAADSTSYIAAVATRIEWLLDAFVEEHLCQKLVFRATIYVTSLCLPFIASCLFRQHALHQWKVAAHPPHAFTHGWMDRCCSALIKMIHFVNPVAQSAIDYICHSVDLPCGTTSVPTTIPSARDWVCHELMFCPRHRCMHQLRILIVKCANPSNT